VTPYDCPGGFGIWMGWDGCGGSDLATCQAGQCGFAPPFCQPSPDPCQGLPSGAPCLALCAQIGCPTPNPLPLAHCDAHATCVVDSPSLCGSSCQSDADCPVVTTDAPWGPCNGTPEMCLFPVCTAGRCGTFVADVSQASCAPMDAHPDAQACASDQQFAWDGTQCVSLLTCACQGGDCRYLLPTESLCEEIHAKCPH
jgi:hypothetical protein